MPARGKQVRRPTGPGAVGAGIDFAGGPVFDPTANVLDLVEKETKRGDDLRSMEERLASSEIRRLEAEIEAIRHIAKLQSRHTRERQQGESARLDSVRQVDIATFNNTISEIRSTLKDLATQTSTTATALQARQDVTAATLAKGTADSVGEVMKRIAALELAAAQGLGKQAVVDPQMERLTGLVGRLADAQRANEGKSAGVSSVMAVGLAALSVISILFGIGMALWKASGNP